jgi:hypothetical protein
MQRMQRIPIGWLVWMQAFPAFAQQPIIYPAKGQSEQRQNAVTAECQLWATGSMSLTFVNRDDVFVAFGNCLTP